MARRNGGSEAGDFQESKAKLAEDLRLVAEDTEQLIKATGGELAAKTREIREHLKVVLADAQETCARLEEQAQAGIIATDRAIRRNPYTAIGIAAGVGFLAALIIKRRL